MNEPLFNGKRQIPNEEVIEKMQYFLNRANELMDLYKKDKKSTLALARELRNELKTEYVNNKLRRIQEKYDNHELFHSYYVPAVTDAYVSISGQLTYENVHSFLNDVESYMKYHIPRKYKTN